MDFLRNTIADGMNRTHIGELANHRSSIELHPHQINYTINDVITEELRTRIMNMRTKNWRSTGALVATGLRIVGLTYIYSIV